MTKRLFFTVRCKLGMFVLFYVYNILFYMEERVSNFKELLSHKGLPVDMFDTESVYLTLS